MSLKPVSYVIISALISFFYFMVESISNYNLGKNKDEFKWNIETLIKLFKIPPLIEVFKIALTVCSFSILSSITFTILDYIYLGLLK